MEALENEIKQYEFKLSKIPDEYNTSMLCEWSAIREKEIYFIRKIAYLKKKSKERELNDKKYKASVVIKKWQDESNLKDAPRYKAKRDPDTHKGNIIDNVLKEDRQPELMIKLLESYEDEENNAQQYGDFIDSLDDESLYNLDNAMDALEINSERINTLEEVKTELMDQGNCDHDWIQGRGDYNIKCAFCIYYPSQENRFTCRYASGKYKLKAINNTDREILAVLNAINTFRLYLGFKEFTVRTVCEAICKYHNKVNSKKSSTRRWVLFEDIITGNGYKVIFEHIKGKDNTLPDIFSGSSIL